MRQIALILKDENGTKVQGDPAFYPTQIHITLTIVAPGSTYVPPATEPQDAGIDAGPPADAATEMDASEPPPDAADAADDPARDAGMHDSTMRPVTGGAPAQGGSGASLAPAPAAPSSAGSGATAGAVTPPPVPAAPANSGGEVQGGCNASGRSSPGSGVASLAGLLVLALALRRRLQRAQQRSQHPRRTPTI